MKPFKFTNGRLHFISDLLKNISAPGMITLALAVSGNLAVSNGNLISLSVVVTTCIIVGLILRRD